jgi:hypothetical protein
MLQEHRIGNISFRKAIDPAGYIKAKLNIGGIAISLQQATWNDLVSLTEMIGKLEMKEAEEEKETIETSTDVEVEETTKESAMEVEETTEENEDDTELTS